MPRWVSISWADEPEIEPEITILRLDSPRKNQPRVKVGLDVMFRLLHGPQQAVCSTLRDNVWTKIEKKYFHYNGPDVLAVVFPIIHNESQKSTIRKSL